MSWFHQKNVHSIHFALSTSHTFLKQAAKSKNEKMVFLHTLHKRLAGFRMCTSFSRPSVSQGDVIKIASYSSGKVPLVYADLACSEFLFLRHWVQNGKHVIAAYATYTSTTAYTIKTNYRTSTVSLELYIAHESIARILLHYLHWLPLALLTSIL